METPGSILSPDIAMQIFRANDPVQVDLPDRTCRSIFKFLADHLTDEGLSAEARVLPDDSAVPQTARSFGPGAADGIGTHHVATIADTEQSSKLLQLLEHFCKQPSSDLLRDIYTHVVDHRAVTMIDAVANELGKTRDENLYQLGRLLALESADREPAKLGVVLLGIFARPDDRKVLVTFALHDEFTLFALFGLSRFSDSEMTIWTIARHVRGWGRIHLVERLSATTDPEIRRWLVREGFRNEVMNEYLALLCARAGGLAEQLKSSAVDDELLDAASEIIEALLNLGGPRGDIRGYGDGVIAVETFLRHLEKRPIRESSLRGVRAIAAFLKDGSVNWASLEKLSWTSIKRMELQASSARILKRAQLEAAS